MTLDQRLTRRELLKAISSLGGLALAENVIPQQAEAQSNDK